MFIINLNKMIFIFYSAELGHEKCEGFFGSILAQFNASNLYTTEEKGVCVATFRLNNTPIWSLPSSWLMINAGSCPLSVSSFMSRNFLKKSLTNSGWDMKCLLHAEIFHHSDIKHYIHTGSFLELSTLHFMFILIPLPFISSIIWWVCWVL